MKQPEISINILGQMTVLDEINESVILEDLWEKKTAVLVFVRHFG